MHKGFRLSRAALAGATFALLASLAPSAYAQGQAATPQTQSQPRQTTPATATGSDAAARPDAPPQTPAQTASAPAGEAVAAKPAAPEPLYREYRGVRLGMSAAEVRAKLGRPSEKSDAMDFYVFSDRERARVYYTGGKASAVIATYVGKDAQAPTPASVLGTEVEAKPDGSMYRMTPYPQAGYWVAYSRTPGDSPLVIVTMQKTP